MDQRFLLAVALVTQRAPAARRLLPPVRIPVPFSATAQDTVAQVLRNCVAGFGTIVVDNKPGANGIIGLLRARAAADGHTLILTSSATHSGIGALWQPGYDPIADFAHISRIATIPMVSWRGRGAVQDRAGTGRAGAPDAAALRLRQRLGADRRGHFQHHRRSPSDAILSQPPAITDLLGGQIDYVLPMPPS